MIVLIDNYDSFTFNLAQYLRSLGAELAVIRNDAATVSAVLARRPKGIIISPGPGTPDDGGMSLDLIATAAPLPAPIPILGVCLGHQVIAQHFGGRIVRAPTVMHGKTSPIHHAGTGVFATLPNPFTATRYHSLTVAPESMPDCLEVTAWTPEDTGEAGTTAPTIMGLRHRTLPFEGVQFHPEAILTEHGHALLGNFLARTR